MRQSWWCIALVMLLGSQALGIEGACAVPEGATPTGIASQGPEARLRFLSKLLEEEGKAAERWTLGWGGLYGTMVVAQLAVMPLFAKEEWPDWYWGAGSALVGVAFAVIDPLEVLHAGAPYARKAEQVTAEDTCQVLLEGERLLREGAEHEAAGTQWYLHAGNVAFNAGLGLVLGLGYQRWTSALINFLVGTAIGELTFFTSPNRLISGRERYLKGDKPVTGVSVLVVPTAGPGVGVLVTF